MMWIPTTVAVQNVRKLVHPDTYQQVPLIPLPVMKEPFERIVIDIVGSLPCSRKGYQYVLVICDYVCH